FAIRIHAGNVPPEAFIASPADGVRFAVGQPLTLSGRATDAEDGALAPAALSWTAVLRHGGHTHPYAGPLVGNHLALARPPPEHRAAASTTALEIALTATDSGGASGTVTRLLQPRLVPLTFTTDPPGLQLVAGGLALSGPSLRASWEGLAIPVDVPDQVFHG